MRWHSTPLQGDLEVYDGTNEDAIEAFAGDSWVGMRPVVRDGNGREVTLGPGWELSRADGQDGLVASSPAAWPRLHARDPA